MVRHASVAAAIVVVVALGACGSDPGRSTSAPANRPARTLPPQRGDIVAALAPLPGGGLRYGELRSGRIRDRGSARVLARVPVLTGGQRGLLGLAVDRGRTFAAFTARD